MTEDQSLPLVRRVQKGDGEALETLLARHLPGLRGFVQVRAGDLLRDKEDVSDLVQSTCREVLEDIEHVAWEGEVHFKRWLYQAALRKVVDKARYWAAARRDVGREAPNGQPSHDSEGLGHDAPDAGGGTPSTLVAGKEELRRVEDALRRLSKDHREVILMARFLGLSHAEMARELGRSEGAVRGLLHRALGALRRELGEDAEDSGLLLRNDPESPPLPGE